MSCHDDCKDEKEVVVSPGEEGLINIKFEWIAASLYESTDVVRIPANSLRIRCQHGFFRHAVECDVVFEVGTCRRPNAFGTFRRIRTGELVVQFELSVTLNEFVEKRELIFHLLNLDFRQGCGLAD